MAGRQKIGEKFSIVLTPDLAALIEEAKQATGEETSPLLRKAIRAGLPIVKSGGGGDVLTLDSELSGYVDAIAKSYQMTRPAVILEAVWRGARSVNVHHMHTTTKDIPPEMVEAMIRRDPDAEPHLREVRAAKIAKGALEIQLDDLLRHVPEAKERKELIEKHHELTRKRYASGPSMWGHGVSTENLKKNIASMEAELARGEGPTPESVAALESLKAIEQSSPRYTLKSVSKLPVQTVKPAKKKSSK